MAKPDYSDVIGAIYEAAMLPDLWAGALEMISDYLGADSGMVLHLSAAGDRNFIIHRRLRDDLNQLFLRHHTRNPYAAAFTRAPSGQALVTEALIEKDLLCRSAFYADILAPQGIAEIVAVKHADLSRNGVGGVLFNFSKLHADDAGHAAARLDGLIPHLSRAIDVTLLVGRSNTRRGCLDHILADMVGAAVLLDHEGRILQMTRMAQALLEERDGLLASRGKLEAQTREDSRRLAASIQQALAVARGEPRLLDRPLQIKRPSGQKTLLVQVTPLPARPFSLWEAIDRGPRVIVQIVDPQAAIQAQAEQLRLLVGLTGAEARVSALLGAGLGLAAAARALGVSMNTVKTHARRVFDKAGVRSSAALVRLMASIPVGLPCSARGDEVGRG
jgi:DNA-binding CsgD family transcriptional regulator